MAKRRVDVRINIYEVIPDELFIHKIYKWLDYKTFFTLPLVCQRASSIFDQIIGNKFYVKPRATDFSMSEYIVNSEYAYIICHPEVKPPLKYPLRIELCDTIDNVLAELAFYHARGVRYESESKEYRFYGHEELKGQIRVYYDTKRYREDVIDPEITEFLSIRLVIFFFRNKWYIYHTPKKRCRGIEWEIEETYISDNIKSLVRLFIKSNSKTKDWNIPSLLFNAYCTSL